MYFFFLTANAVNSPRAIKILSTRSPSYFILTKWVESAEKVYITSHSCILEIRFTNILWSTGGKAKPLKAAKKEKKELDEDELAHQAKIKAGMSF